MSLPRPSNGQKKKDFISVCMANPTMNKEFKDSGQRFAVCETQWEKSKKSSKAVVAELNNEEILFFIQKEDNS